ncbi:hypothetical protein FJO69_02310 [[Mycoplasma] falconis]|uniref:PA14 domain-containing protein n=1 Tax=[Mycoplasma] falconis TaxID=92403 RepID=A0A501X9T8_9BACT|nr:PA14 domain-containing protein [[Mycoplasma] falconis]TPE57143.1 hypothetical protein FJO69_02310 [[Mycoplasma] falconis]
MKKNKKIYYAALPLASAVGFLSLSCTNSCDVKAEDQQQLEAKAQNVHVVLNVEPKDTIASLINQSNITFSGFNQNDYEIIELSFLSNGTTLTVSYKLKNKHTNLISKTNQRVFEGFKESTIDDISDEDKIYKSRVEVSNKGYFIDKYQPITLSFASDFSDFKPLSYKWYANDVQVYQADQPVLLVKQEQIAKDSKYQLEITWNSKGEIKTHKFDAVDIFKTNPLADVLISASNNGLLVDNKTTLQVENKPNNQTIKTTWYNAKTNNELAQGDTYEANEESSYYAIIENKDQIKWKTNEVKVSDLPLANLNADFKAQLVDKVTNSTYSDKILSYVKRTPNKEVYETDLLKEYGDKGFRYPGWDYNYEANNQEKSFLTYEENGKSVKVNVSEKLMAERVPGTDKKFNDTQWIKSEIEKGTLKKHPFADCWFKRNVTDKTLSVTKEFKLSTFMTGMNATGLFIPAGEVAEIEFDEETYEMLKSIYGGKNADIAIKFIVNENYWDNYPFNDSGRISNRYPYMRTEFRYWFKDIDANTRRIKLGSPFGGSISAYITAKLTDKTGSPLDLKFKIYNAVENLHYVYGQTTKEEWEEQLKRIRQGKINAPVASIQTNYSSILVPAPLPKVGNIALKNLVFPEENIKKWEDFYETSYLWNDYSGPKLSLKYNDDIWGWAAAWGGGFNLYAPVSWGARYFSGPDKFGFDNWGNYHEVNQNFENYQDPFNIRDHGWTNIPSLINTSFINDKNAYRTVVNLDNEGSAGWASLSSINAIAKNRNDWYGLYGAMIYQLGPINFMKWTKASAKADKHNKGLETTKFLSDYFGLNMHYAMKSFNKVGDKFNKYIADEANNDLIKQMNEYPAIDFVGNIYAAGQYRYIPSTNSWEYPSDTMSEFLIPAGKEYVFDFNIAIRSKNPNFKFDQVIIAPSTKWGGTIKQDLNDKNKFIYKANPDFYDKIDEFDVTIIPSKFEGRPDKYVPAYKYKVKVRSIYNALVGYSYDSIPEGENVSSVTKVLEAVEKHNLHDKAIRFVADSGAVGGYINWEKRKLVEMRAKFVAPETSDYKFNAQWDDYVYVFVNGEKIVEKNSYGPSFQDLATYHFEKGKVYDIRFGAYNGGGEGGINMRLIQVKDDGSFVKFVDMAANSLLDDIDTDNMTDEEIQDLLTNQSYKHQPRFKEKTSDFDIQTQRLNIEKKINEEFNFKELIGNANLAKIMDGNVNRHFEIWNTRAIKAQVEYKNPINLNYFDVRRRDHWSQKEFAPDFWTITLYFADGSQETVVDGIVPTNDYKTLTYRIKLAKNYYNVKKMAIYGERKQMGPSDQNGVVLAEFIPGFEFKQPDVLNINNPNIDFYGDWTFHNNKEDGYGSLVNEISVESKSKGSYLEFDLPTKDLSIIANIFNQNSKVDFYVDNKLIYQDYEFKGVSGSFNSNVLQYIDSSLNNGSHHFKIVNKGDEPLIINYFGYTNTDK